MARVNPWPVKTTLNWGRSSMISARPAMEAAGISGLYQRRHEAELRGLAALDEPGPEFAGGVSGPVLDPGHRALDAPPEPLLDPDRADDHPRADLLAVGGLDPLPGAVAVLLGQPLVPEVEGLHHVPVGIDDRQSHAGRR